MVRRQILDKANALFLQEGPGAVSLNRLCRELHIAKKTFYRHFANKDALLAALVDERMAAYGAALLTAPPATAPPEERLPALLERVLTVSASSFSAVYLRDIEADHPELWARLTTGRQALVGVIHHELERGQRSGVFRTEATPADVVAIVGLLVDRVLDPVSLVDRGLEPHRVARVLFTLLLEGLVLPGARPPPGDAP